MDYYGALNVTKASNASEIKSKYRRLALQYHPDKLQGLDKKIIKRAEENFKIIAEGKEVGSSASSRGHDRLGGRGGEPELSSLSSLVFTQGLTLPLVSSSLASLQQPQRRKVTDRKPATRNACSTGQIAF